MKTNKSIITLNDEKHSPFKANKLENINNKIIVDKLEKMVSGIKC